MEIKHKNNNPDRDTEIVVVEIPKNSYPAYVPEGAKLLGKLDSKEKKDKINRFLDGIAFVANGVMSSSGKALSSLGEKVAEKRKYDEKAMHNRFSSKEFGTNSQFAGLDEDFIEDDILLQEDADLYPVTRYSLPTMDPSRRFVDETRRI
jgi:hypothetical protein